jgi:hypothetical protein
MSDIFISYSRTDKQQADLLAEKFAQQGWTVWWDREIPPGKSFDDTIEEALNSAKCVVVIWSQNSASSQWVKTEAAEGAARGILVPILIDNVKIPLEFKRIEAADLSDWQGESSHFEFDHLIKTIGNLLSGAAKPIIRQNPTIVKSNLQRWWKNTLRIVTVTAGLAAFGIDQHSVPSMMPPVNLAKNQPEQVAEPSTQKLKDTVLAHHKQINLFAPENGVQLLAASSDRWKITIDGKEDWQYIDLGKEAVYGFKDERPATFDLFTMLIMETTDMNVKEFELLAGNDSPTGTFESIGKFQTQNVKLFKTPYQEFKFPAVTARFLKIKVLSTYGFSSASACEFQLFGSLK